MVVIYGKISESKLRLGVNIKNIWHDSKNQDDFIKKFSLTYSHELIHILVHGIVSELRLVGEEMVIRKMLRESRASDIRRYYEKTAKDRYRKIDL